MKLEVGKTYRHNVSDAVWHIAGRMDDGRLFGWMKREDNYCSPVWFDDDADVEEYTPPRTLTFFVNVNVSGGPGFSHPTIKEAKRVIPGAAQTLEITYTEDPAGGPGTATVKVLP